MARAYYQEKLSAERLKRVYEIASPRVRQYLQAEIDFVLGQMAPGDRVLELGCGYGRVLDRLAEKSQKVFGIDTSPASLEMGNKRHQGRPPYGLAAMDALQLGFCQGSFDLVVCIQNGISAFQVDPLALMREALRVIRHSGLALFSSYAESFWAERLGWFQAQADEGLLGKIDKRRTGNGVIVCEDGFRATTMGPTEFAELVHFLGFEPVITEVDGSSLFCGVRRWGSTHFF
ncbi:MAG: class I SAM-dependent methyltransferase [Deltaproteobacteria bacterium]|nr:class I SAM-dependent methyltransferase [Deltaproteobacteria bacterium]